MSLVVVVVVVSLFDTGDTKMRLVGGPKMTHRKVAGYQFLKALGGGDGGWGGEAVPFT